MIEFHLDGGSGVSAYMQIVHQVKQALRLGMLRPGDQLPTVRDVVATLAINPNTVLKAYRELEMEGLVAGRQGQGTFVTRSLAGPALADHAELRAELVEWLERAWRAGMDDESIDALLATTLREQVTRRARASAEHADLAERDEGAA
jgi:GntR family transcriptional regulator